MSLGYCLFGIDFGKQGFQKYWDILVAGQKCRSIVPKLMHPLIQDRPQLCLNAFGVGGGRVHVSCQPIIDLFHGLKQAVFFFVFD